MPLVLFNPVALIKEYRVKRPFETSYQSDKAEIALFCLRHITILNTKLC